MAYEIKGMYEWEPALSLHQQVVFGQALETFLNVGGTKARDLVKPAGLITSADHAVWATTVDVDVQIVEDQLALWADLQTGFLIPIPGAVAPLRYWLNIAKEPALFFQLVTDLGL